MGFPAAKRLRLGRVAENMEPQVFHLASAARTRSSAVEQILYTDKVTGSIPVASTILPFAPVAIRRHALQFAQTKQDSLSVNGYANANATNGVRRRWRVSWNFLNFQRFLYKMICQVS
jgi:hypothetical protein